MAHDLTGPPEGPVPSRAPLFLLAAIVAVLAVFFVSRAMRARRATGEGAASHAAGDAGHGGPLTEQPAPVTPSPEASAAYAAGLKDLRDGSISLSGFDLYRASRLDTAFAAANLALAWRALYAEDGPGPAPFLVATRYKRSFDERGVLLLHAAEALSADPPDLKEVVTRLRAVSKRFPYDAETLFYLGSALEQTGRVDEARKMLHRALVADPAFAGALWLLAESHMDDDDDLAAAGKAADECLIVSPSASGCLRVRALVDRELGRCAELEDDARRMTVVEPNGPRAYEYLAAAIAASEAAVEPMNAALDKWRILRVADDPSREDGCRSSIDAALAALTGDFVAGEAAAREREGLVEEDTSEERHSGPTLLHIEFLEEQGNPEKAAAVAEAFEGRVSEWTADDPAGVRLYLLYARHHDGRLDDEAFKKARDELLGEPQKRWDRRHVGLGALYVYAKYAKTPDEVDDALARFSLPLSLYVPTEIKALMGRVYLLGGQKDEALPFLRRAAAPCRMLPELEDTERRTTVDFMHTRLALGQALEETGDKAGACDAYALIVDRWKDAKPRSVTLEKAKARVKALACRSLAKGT